MIKPSLLTVAYSYFYHFLHQIICYNKIIIIIIVKCCNAQFAKLCLAKILLLCIQFMHCNNCYFYHAAAPSSDIALYVAGAILVGAVIIVVGIAGIVIMYYRAKKEGMQFV